MHTRIWLVLLSISAWTLGMASQPGETHLAMQDTQEMPFRPFPFSIPPERQTGPPRAEGELPSERGLPPTDMPGQREGPPRAQGVAPPLSQPDQLRPQPLPGPPPLGPVLGVGEDSALPPIFSQTKPLDLPGLSDDSPGASSFGGARSLGPADGFGPPAQLGPRLGSDVDLFASPGPLPPIAPGEQPDLDEIRSLVEPIDLIPSEGLFAEFSPLLPQPPPVADPDPPAPLSLSEILVAAEYAYPPFLEILQQPRIATADLQRVLGPFDLRLDAEGRNWALGYYQRWLYDVFVSQRSTNWGTRYFAGYRLGLGVWPIYYQYLDTLNGGAYVAGMELPLLKDGPIDAERARVMQAEIARRQVTPAVSRRRIDLIRDVTKVYWNWVAIGQNYWIKAELLRIAEDRNRAIARQVELGLVSPLELVDNQRIIVQRQAMVLDAKRRFQQAALELSLYNRDARGFPDIPSPDRVPPAFPQMLKPSVDRLGDDIDAALLLRPEMLDLNLESQSLDIDRRLAENSLLPELNFYLYAEQNTGPPKTTNRNDIAAQVEQRIERNKAPFIMEASLLFSVPLQRREPRGRLRVADAKITQLRLRQQFLRDQIAVQVKDAVAALQATYGQMIALEQAYEAARRLELAERRRFELGLSSVLLVYIREQATADALSQTVDAGYRFFTALADYRAALGIDALPPDSVTVPLPPDHFSTLEYHKTGRY
ncbi:TolC family protein [Tautonia rosea]|uniref:TolC family protein n=1 Tax=Tautonia rosea TaxID=2728037 RepID=UPI0014735337|nr:TolC family protein [Tautonia rosea]